MPSVERLRSGTLRGDLDKHDVSYELVAEATRLELRLVCREPEAPSESFHLQIDVGSLATCKTIEETSFGRTTRPVVWEMCETAASLEEPFGEVALWLSNRLLGDEKQPPVKQPWVELCDELTSRALERCDACARESAATFHPRTRFYVYSAIMAHGARLEQCARVCPGLMLALHLLSRTRRDGPVLAAINEGRRLNVVLHQTLEALRVESLGRQTGAPDSSLERVLIRRAPASLDPRLLQHRPPRGVRVDDIPRDADAAGWYRAVLALSAGRRFRELDEHSQERLGGFVSRNSAELAADARAMEKSIESLVTEITDYAARSGQRVPTRRSNVDRVLLDVARWHLEVACRSDLPLDAPLACVALPKPRYPLRVRMLQTMAELIAEGGAMGHCVASHADEAHAGELFLLSADYLGERLTVAIEPWQRGFRIVEVAGRCNRLPSPEADRAIQEWVASCADQ